MTIYGYKFESSLVQVTAYQLGAKPNNFDDLSSHSKRFRYFFQFLKFQVEETYFFHEAIVILTLRDRTF